MGTNNKYAFDLQHENSVKRKTSQDIDKLLLVFLSEFNEPMYYLNFKEVEHIKRTMTIRMNTKKYNLEFLGFLGN